MTETERITDAILTLVSWLVSVGTLGQQDLEKMAEILKVPLGREDDNAK